MLLVNRLITKGETHTSFNLVDVVLTNDKQQTVDAFLTSA